MKIACVQFAPKLGEVKNNIAKVDSLLETVSHSDVDWLVLPELAFTGR